MEGGSGLPPILMPHPDYTQRGEGHCGTSGAMAWQGRGMDAKGQFHRIITRGLQLVNDRVWWPDLMAESGNFSISADGERKDSHLLERKRSM